MNFEQYEYSLTGMKAVEIYPFSKKYTYSKIEQSVTCEDTRKMLLNSCIVLWSMIIHW